LGVHAGSIFRSEKKANHQYQTMEKVQKPSNSKMDIVLTFKTVVNFYKATQRYIQTIVFFIVTAVRTFESFIFIEESCFLGYNSIIAQIGIIMFQPS
jgi:hypothetical protein